MSPLLLLVALAAAPVDELKSDPLYRALSEEVARARTLRTTPQNQKNSKPEVPYWVAAYANEEESFSVSASFGALVNKGSAKRIGLLTQMRVGSPDFDQTNFTDFSDFGLSGRRGSPSEPDYDALRRALWLQLDGSYKGAVEAIAKKRAWLETNQVPERLPDFASAKVETLVEPRLKLEVDRERWAKTVRKLSAVFREHSAAHTSLVAFQSQVLHQSMVSTDPGLHRFGERLTQLLITASTQAPDGMELRSRIELSGRGEGDLPSDEELLKVAQKVAQRLDQLAKAPALKEDYQGPVLFVGRAAPGFFLQALGDPLSRPRDSLGNLRQGRLVERLGKHITSRLVNASDDPLQTEWKGQPLLGHFPVDDDGVKPKPISLVEEGVLKTYYMSRIPTKRVKESNGHARGGQGAVGNLFVSTKEPSSREQLKKRLIELAKEEDLDYGLMVEEFDDAAGLRFGNGADGVTLSAPAVVYRVYANGKEELVRGLSFKPVTFRVLKDIVGMGGEQELTLINTAHRGQRVSVVAPSVLVKSLELQRAKEEFEKPPLLPRPVVAGK